MTRARTILLLLVLTMLVPARLAGAAEHGDTAAPRAAPQNGEEQEKREVLPPPYPLVSADEAAKQPYGLVRTLQSIQDQVAQGSATAHELQKRFLAQLNAEMRQLPPEVWDDPRNARAAVIFVLSGGDPRLANDLLSRTAPAPVDEQLLKAALAFGEGRPQDAIQFFEHVKVRELEPGMAGLVALIYGTLLAKKEPKKAIALFDEARLAAPGTLIEESALRQEILLLAREGYFDRFDTLSSQYARRFGKSIYARNFRRQFFAGVARQDFKGTSEWISRTEAELMRLAPGERAGAYLSIAEEATLSGNVTIARFAAEKAAELIAKGGAASARSQLYKGAAFLLSDDFDKGLETLKAVPKDKLGAGDKEILDAALSLAGQLRKWPDAPQESAEPLPASVVQAQDLVSKVDTLLGGGAQ